jgi:arsenical pump membrane protein
LRRQKLNVSFGSFLKVGAIVMPLTLLLSLGGAILMQLLFAK